MGRKRAANNRTPVRQAESLEQKVYRRDSLHRAFDRGGRTAKRVRELDRLNREIQILTEESRGPIVDSTNTSIHTDNR